VADIGSQIILNRSGAAVTLQEFERSRPFIPKPTDAPDVVKTKIAYLKKIVQEENDALNETAKRMGYRVPQQASRAPTLDDVANEILRRRPGGQ
jgi:LysM repeat protein